MNIKEYVQSNARLYYWCCRLLIFINPVKYQDSGYDLEEIWINRTNEVISSPDNVKIYRDSKAGEIENNFQYMHNSIKIGIASYYGFGVNEMLKKNRGVHEPQEEFVFQEVLKLISDDSVMIELGSNWSFYSLWFNKEVKNAINFMIEPDCRHLFNGKRNFELNKRKGYFKQAFIGSASSKINNVDVIFIDDFIKINKLKRVSILHADIQGFEFEMLEGAKNSIENKIIDYLFISTHSNQLHYQCVEFLKTHNYFINTSVDLDNSYSFDGIIVASSTNKIIYKVSQKRTDKIS